MLDPKFKIHSFFPPGISVLEGITYVIPGWHIVPTDTTLDEVKERWTQDLPPMKEKPDHPIFELVDASKGGKQYEVTFDGRWWNCTCTGFGFRRKCKHLTEVKEKHNISP